MGAPHISDAGAKFKMVACGLTVATAAGTGDATAVTGASIDRLGYGSLKLCVAYKTSLTADKTLALAVAYQESSDNSSWDTAVALQASTVAETGELTAEVDEIVFDLDLGGKKRYIRFNFTPDLSHSGTDTAVVAAVATLAGAATLPAT